MGLNESHPAHVRGKIEDLVAPIHRLITVFLDAQVEDHVFDAGVDLIPLIQWLDIHCAHPMSHGVQCFCGMAADKSAGSSNNDLFHDSLLNAVF